MTEYDSGLSPYLQESMPGAQAGYGNTQPVPLAAESGCVPTAPEAAAVTPSEAIAESRALFEHSRTPVTMRNFLLRVMPDAADEILGLKSWQSSLLTRQLLDLYRSMDLPELTEDELANRCALIERWTGLYGLAQDIDEITERSVQPRKTIHNRIDRVILLMTSRLSDNKRAALLRRAAATPKPTHDT